MNSIILYMFLIAGGICFLLSIISYVSKLNKKNNDYIVVLGIGLFFIVMGFLLS